LPTGDRAVIISGMRRISDPVDSALASRFVSVLSQRDIGAKALDEDGGKATVWVIEEDQVAAADALWTRFVATPDDPEFKGARGARVGKEAGAKPAAGKDGARRARFIDVRRDLWPRSNWINGTVTTILIVASVVATALAKSDMGPSVLGWLDFSLFPTKDFYEIRAGQVWRLVTPIFPHGGVIHILFNMLWLHQLGGLIERTEGSRYFAALVLVSAVVSNTAQYLVVGPYFGGMSGVVYALFGYVWMMARYDAKRGYSMAQQTATIMLIWLVVCILGIVPNVANTAHVAGIVVGCLWGLIRSAYWRQWARRRAWRDKHR
jgi:GlpG protein